MTAGAYQHFAGGLNEYPAKNVIFDGVNDYASADSMGGGENTGLFSCWVKPDAAANRDLVHCSSGNNLVLLQFNADGKIDFRWVNGGLTVALQSTYTVGEWHHVLFAANGTTAHLYVNGVQVAGGTGLGASFLFPSAAWNFFHTEISEGSKTDFFDGAIADFYLTNEYLDITQAANRAKFTQNNKTVFLGSQGARPTGTRPLVLFSGDKTAFTTNKGSASTTFTGSLQDGIGTVEHS